MKKPIVYLLALLLATAALLYLSPATLFASVQWLERQRAGVSARQVSVGDLSIHYYVGGPQAAQSIVMLHGFAANKDNWLRFARDLSRDYQVLAIDLPGFGASDRPAGSYDVGTQAERLASILTALEIEQAHLIGNSMGGHIAALYAARYPERTLSLGLFNNAGVDSPQLSELRQIIQRGEANPLVVRNREDFERLLQFVFVEPPYLPDSLKGYLASQASANSAHYDRVFKHLIERYIPLEPELGKVRAPTLLLWGEQDRVLHVSSIEAMRPLLHQPSVVVMANTGHAPMIERPQQTAAHYRAFLDTLQE